MELDTIYTNVEKATVTTLRKGGGQGVLVNGNFIITAAHCLDWNCDGGLILGEHSVEEIRAGGNQIKVTPVAIEPVNDIAVLGSLDSQEFSESADAFEEFCEVTKPVPLCQRDFELFQSFSVHIYTHKGIWVNGDVKQMKKETNALYIEADEQIEGGTSGGPIINDSGELIGIASNFSFNESEGKASGTIPRLHRTLPSWICQQIFGAS